MNLKIRHISDFLSNISYFWKYWYSIMINGTSVLFPTDNSMEVSLSVYVCGHYVTDKPASLADSSAFVVHR